MSPSKDATPSQVAAVVSFYMSAALVMVFVNKAVLTSFGDLPLLFLFNQLVLAVVLLHAASFMSKKVEIPKLDYGTAQKLFPVISVNVIGLVFNTLCLRGVEASFFQIARGLILPLTVVISAICTSARPSRRVLLAACIVTAGFFLGVSPAGIPVASAPSVLSLIYGVFSSLFIALHAVFVKTALPHCNYSAMQLAYWTNAGSAVLLLPFVALSNDPMRFRQLLHAPDSDISLFVWGSLVTGFFGFLLCISAAISIKVTSPITHMFSSAARSVIQTLLGVWLFQDLLTVNRATSIMVILAGTMYYTWVKSVEGASPPNRPCSADVEKGKFTAELSTVPVGVTEKMDEKRMP